MRNKHVRGGKWFSSKPQRSWRVALLLLFAIVQVQCQSVSYTHRTFGKGSAIVHYYAVWQESKPSLLVTVESDKMDFDEHPVLQLRFFGVDEPLRVEGEQLPPIVVEDQGMIRAKFPLDEEDVELFAKGVSKVRLSTMPYTHEKTFKRDGIGKRLFREFQKAKAKDTDF